MANRFSLLLLIFTVLLISSCTEESSPPENNATELTHIYTYVSHGESFNPTSCVDFTRSCSVAELPFMSLSYSSIQIQDIMSRVVVSHDWMGQRFEALLTLLPNEILPLFGSVTAIVIADNIRPSFYWTGSGAIYLDSAYFWLTNAEKQTIDQTPDKRSAFSSGLRYDFFHRFIKDGQAAYPYYSLTGTAERNIDNIIIPIASLLLHELAHANDFMPPTLMTQLNMSAPLWSEINRFNSRQLNTTLKQIYPITDNTLKIQAAILYLEQQATPEQQSVSAEELGLLMQQEGANHLYAYSHQAEDVAMLFQASMLNYFYDVEMDSAFVIQPEADSVTCNDYIVAWGQRNRIADPLSKPRARFVSQQILPSINFNLFFEQLADAQYFPALTSWCNSQLSEPSAENRALKTVSNDQQKIKIRIKKDHHHGAIITLQ